MDARELEDRKIPYTPAFIRTTCTLTYQRGYEEIYVDKLITADGLGVYALSREDIDVWKCAGPYRDIAIENATTDLRKRIEALEEKQPKHGKNSKTPWRHGYIVAHIDDGVIHSVLDIGTNISSFRVGVRTQRRISGLIRVFDRMDVAHNYAIKTPDADLHIYLCKYKYWGLPVSWLPEIPGTVLASSIRPVMEVEYDHS